jgi:predicted MFS family arabinose efflux permease
MPIDRNIHNAAAVGPDFYKLWLGQTISQFGSWLGAFGLLAIVQLDATPAQMGVLETLRAAPVLLLGLFAGVWVDRLRRRPVLVAVDVGRGVLLVLTALAALTGRLRIEHLYGVGFVVGGLTLFFNIAYRAYLPALVTRAQLVSANSRLSASESLAEIASPGLGGFLVRLVGAPLTLMLDAGSFLLSAFFVGLIRNPEVPHRADARQYAKENVWREISSGLGFLIHHPVLRSLAGAAATSSFFGGFFAALYSLFVLRAVELSTTALGLLIGAGGVGALIGSLWAGRVSRRLGRGKTLIVTLFFSSALNLLIPLAQGPVWAVILLLLIPQIIGDFFLVIYSIVEISVRQAATPDAMLGRVTASYEFIAQGTGTIGILAGGLVGSAIGTRRALVVAAVGTTLAIVWLLTSSVRRLEMV